MKRVVVVAVAALIVSLMGWSPAQAANCPPASVGGPAVAMIHVRGTTVPVKSITFRNGGALDPPHTNQAAGISARNQPLTSKKGATVITWHVRYGPGCPGTLNAVTTMPIGSTFTVGKVGVTPRTYKIVSRETVPKGTLRRTWFRNDGPRKLVLITCDSFTGRYFARTMAVTAVPVPTPTAPVSSRSVGAATAR